MPDGLRADAAARLWQFSDAVALWAALQWLNDVRTADEAWCALHGIPNPPAPPLRVLLAPHRVEFGA